MPSPENKAKVWTWGKTKGSPRANQFCYRTQGRWQKKRTLYLLKPSSLQMAKGIQKVASTRTVRWWKRLRTSSKFKDIELTNKWKHTERSQMFACMINNTTWARKTAMRAGLTVAASADSAEVITLARSRGWNILKITTEATRFRTLCFIQAWWSQASSISRTLQGSTPPGLVVDRRIIPRSCKTGRRAARNGMSSWASSHPRGNTLSNRRHQ